MSSNTFKSEHQRITDLEQALGNLTTRIGYWQGGGLLGGLMPVVWMPGGKGGEPLPGGCGEPVGNDPLDNGSTCRVSAELTQEGSFDYARVGVNDPCPAFKPTDLAAAVVRAEAKLLDFGQARCDVSDEACRSNDCRAALTGTVKVGEGSTSNRIEDGRKICTVTVPVTGTVACRCGNG